MHPFSAREGRAQLRCPARRATNEEPSSLETRLVAVGAGPGARRGRGRPLLPRSLHAGLEHRRLVRDPVPQRDQLRDGGRAGGGTAPRERHRVAVPGDGHRVRGRGVHRRVRGARPGDRARVPPGGEVGRLPDELPVPLELRADRPGVPPVPERPPCVVPLADRHPGDRRPPDRRRDRQHLRRLDDRRRLPSARPPPCDGLEPAGDP